MQSLLGLILRYLRAQRRQSVLTVAGIALSVGLLTSIGIVAGSLNATQIAQARAHYGDYHLGLRSLDGETAAVAARHALGESTGVSVPLGVHYLPGKSLFISVEGWNAAARDLFGLQVAQGRFPEAEGEIALERWLVAQMEAPPALGDRITLPVARADRPDRGGQGQPLVQESFTLVGILKDLPGAKATGASLGLVTAATALERLASAQAEHNLFLRLKSEGNIAAAAARIQQDLGLPAESVQINQGLARALGESGKPNWIAMFLGALVLVATVAVIYNIFHIAVLERVRQFGMLRSLGATPAQIRRVVLGEAMVLGLVGIPMGLLIGVAVAVGVAGSLAALAGQSVPLAVGLPVLGGGALLGFVATAGSAYHPATAAARLSPMEAIRALGTGDRKAVRRQSRGNRLIQRLFGIAGVIAYENLWRNRGRSLVTVFSLSLAVVLFVVFSFFGAGASPENVLGQYIRSDYRLETGMLTGAAGFTAEELAAMAAIPGVASVSPTQFQIVTWYPSPERAAEIVRSAAGPGAWQLTPSGEIVVGAALNGYTEAALASAAHLTAAGVLDPARMRTEPLVAVLGEGSGLQPGDQLRIRPPGRTTRETVLTVAAVLTYDSFLASMAPQRPVGPHLIVHTDHFGLVTGNKRVQRVDVTLAEPADRDRVGAALEQIAARVPRGTLVDYAAELERVAGEKRQVMVLIYGLIGAITVIGLFNIVNTVTTNLILRVREFGTLRAVGMTGGEMARMIRLEGLFYGLISAFWGSVAGTALAYGLYLIMARSLPYLRWEVPLGPIALAWVGTLVITVLTTLPPTRRILSLPVIESIRAVE